MIASLPILHPQNVVWSGGEIAVGRAESSLSGAGCQCRKGTRHAGRRAVILDGTSISSISSAGLSGISPTFLGFRSAGLKVLTIRINDSSCVKHDRRFLKRVTCCFIACVGSHFGIACGFRLSLLLLSTSGCVAIAYRPTSHQSGQRTFEGVRVASTTTCCSSSVSRRSPSRARAASTSQGSSTILAVSR